MEGNRLVEQETRVLWVLGNLGGERGAQELSALSHGLRQSVSCLSTALPSGEILV